MISIIHAVRKRAIPLLQVFAVLLTALLMGSVRGDSSQWPTLYGGMISVINLLWLQWRLKRSERRESVAEIEAHAEQSARRITAALYLTVVERFVIVIALFLLGLVKMNLEPVALVTGFVVGQLVLIVATALLKGESSGEVSLIRGIDKS